MTVGLGRLHPNAFLNNPLIGAPNLRVIFQLNPQHQSARLTGCLWKLLNSSSQFRLSSSFKIGWLLKRRAFFWRVDLFACACIESNRNALELLMLAQSFQRQKDSAGLTLYLFPPINLFSQRTQIKAWQVHEQLQIAKTAFYLNSILGVTHLHSAI